jgi:hypothetical protein
MTLFEIGAFSNEIGAFSNRRHQKRGSFDPFDPPGGAHGASRIRFLVCRALPPRHRLAATRLPRTLFSGLLFYGCLRAALAPRVR